MKNLKNLPPDFGKFYVKNFGEEVCYDNLSIIINNFIQIYDYMYISFCEYGVKSFLVEIKQRLKLL